MKNVRLFYTPKASEFLKGKPPGEYDLKIIKAEVQPNGDLYLTYGLPEEESTAQDKSNSSLQTFTIVYMSTSHKKMAMGVIIVRRQLSLEAATKILIDDAFSHGEEIVILAAFQGEHENLLTKQTTRPSEQIIRGTSRDIPKSP